MQTLKVIQGARAQDIANKIIDLIQLNNAVSVYAVGSETISQAISAIAIAKTSLKEKGKILDIKPVFEEQKRHTQEDDELKTSITFRIIAAPLHISIAAFNPSDEPCARGLN